jgi:hypothetical protein
MTENLPKLITDTQSKIMEVQKTTTKINTEKIYLCISHSNYGTPKAKRNF